MSTSLYNSLADQLKDYRNTIKKSALDADKKKLIFTAVDHIQWRIMVVLAKQDRKFDRVRFLQRSGTSEET